MKKILIFVLCAVMVLSLAACGSSAKPAQAAAPEKYPFDPETGNRIRIDFDPVEASFVKLVFTMSTAARTMGAQAAEICIY